MDSPKIQSNLSIIGVTELVSVAGVKDVLAKIDTGAYSSAIWASDITMSKDGVLSFVLFDKKSPFYTGKRIKTTNYDVKSVRSSIGDTQVRYSIKLPVVICGRTLKTTFTLTNRSRNRYPVLIGRRAISGKFLVDVSKVISIPLNLSNLSKLNQELHENPYKFHQKYYQNQKGTI